MGEVLAATALYTALAVSAMWLLSLALRDASIVDIYWGPGFVGSALVAHFVADAGDPGRRALALGLCAAWGLRLGAYLLWRNAGGGEDPRYQAMRRYWGPRFPWISLVSVFALQGTLQWLVSLPVQATQGSPGGPLGALDWLGAAVVVVGLGFEAIGDWQLARFRADPANAGRVLDTGLWRYTRHPNYFGDCLVWWGLFAIAASTSAGPWTVVGPIVMTVLLLRVSGVALLERSIARRRPDYDDYRQRTSAFFPLPPRSRPTQAAR